MGDVEKSVREFYDKFGWEKSGGASGEDLLFREYSAPYYVYHRGVDARTREQFAGLRGRLLIAGGGDLPDSHLAIARRFASTTCLDISAKGLELAKAKLGGNGEYVLGSILDLPAPDGRFDAVFCAHVIYHIDRDLQEKAVRELVRVTRPGGRVVVIYANPGSLPGRLVELKGKTPLLWRLKRKDPPGRPPVRERPPLYFYAHPLGWWRRFGDGCAVELIPWDVMGNREERDLLVNDAIARLAYRFCAWIEARYPDAAVRRWSYPVVVLTKRAK